MIFEFATAQPKGFAFTLMLGVLVSMFTAVVATRAMLGLLSDFAFFNRAELMGVHASDIETAVDGGGGGRRSRPRTATGDGRTGAVLRASDPAGISAAGGTPNRPAKRRPSTARKKKK